MHAIPAGLVALLLPAVAYSQAALRPAAPPAYRGFTPGITYRAFTERARVLADGDVLRCNTSSSTAQLMECGVLIRDPSDGARFYLSGHFIEGNADVVALYDSAGFSDSRGVALLDRTKHDLTRVFGRPRAVRKSSWEWPYGRKTVRLSWRGRGTGRWVSIMLYDYNVMDRITRYAPSAARRKS